MTHRSVQRPRPLRSAPLFGLLLCAPACVELSQVPPSSRSLFASVHEVREVAAARPFVGLTLEEALLGSLDELEFASGLRVIGVAPGSPAEALGIQTGDVLVSAAGIDLDELDRWHTILGRQQPGGTLSLTVERDGGMRDVELAVGERSKAALPEATRFAERLKARVELETILLDQESGVRAAARVVRLLSRSPLMAAGIREQDVVLSYGDEPVESAAWLARRLSAEPFGESVRLTIRGAAGERAVSLELWQPETRLTRLAVPIVFDYERDLDKDRTSFSFVDVWLFAVYDYRRELTSTRHRLFSLFVFESGTGELTELPEQEGR